MCTYYHLTKMPSTLVIDYVTRYKIQPWKGMINLERLLEDFIPCMGNGPMEFIHPRKKAASKIKVDDLNMMIHTLEEVGFTHD